MNSTSAIIALRKSMLPAEESNSTPTLRELTSFVQQLTFRVNHRWDEFEADEKERLENLISLTLEENLKWYEKIFFGLAGRFFILRNWQQLDDVANYLVACKTLQGQILNRIELESSKYQRMVEERLESSSGIKGSTEGAMNGREAKRRFRQLISNPLP